MTKKSRPGIATVAPRRSRPAGSTAAKTAAKKPKANLPGKEYQFPSEFAPELLIAGLLLVFFLFLLFA